MEINNHSREFCSEDWKWQTSRSLPQTKGKFCSWKLSSLLAIVPWEKPLTQGPLPLRGIFQRRLWNFVNYDPMLQRQALPQSLPGSPRGAAQSSHIRHSNYKTAWWVCNQPLCSQFPYCLLFPHSLMGPILLTKSTEEVLQVLLSPGP